jgi:hypothetical protein
MEMKRKLIAIFCFAIFTMSFSVNSQDIIDLDAQIKTNLDKTKIRKPGSGG